MRAGRALAAAGALLLAGCSGTPADTAEPSPATGELRQFRGGAAQRVVQLTLRTTAPVDVVAARVDLDGFSGGPEDDVDVVLPAGAVVDLPLEYGEVDCGAAPGTATGTLRLRDGDEVVLPLADRGLVARLHEAECAEQALTEAVRFDVAVGAQGTAEGRPSLPVVLTVTRLRAGEPVVVQELGAHIVLAVQPEVPRTPLLELGPDERSAQLRLTLAPSRCDGHALAENKRAGLLGVYAAAGDREPRLTTVTPDEAVQDRLRTFAVEGCRALSPS